LVAPDGRPGPPRPGPPAPTHPPAQSCLEGKKKENKGIGEEKWGRERKEKRKTKGGMVGGDGGNGGRGGGGDPAAHATNTLMSVFFFWFG